MTQTAVQAGEPPALKRRHVVAVTIGNALEFYDFLIYGFFSIQIGHAFFPTQSAYGSLMLSLATFGAGFITRPIGAMVIGAYADRVGRRPAMMLCFIMIGCSIVGMALIPTYAAIGIAAPILAVIARMIQGFSLGGEIGSSTAYLMEASATHRRGFVVSMQGVGQQMANIAGGTLGVALTTMLPPADLNAYGWRIAFLVGALAVPFGLWLRNNLPETLHLPEAVAEAAESTASRKALVRKHWRVLALGFVVLASSTIGSYIFSYIVTYSQATLHMTARIGFVAVTLGNLLSIFSVLLGGWLSDKRGRQPINIWGNLAFLLMIYPVFTWIVSTHSATALVVGTATLMAIGSFKGGSLYANLSESLPKSIRGSGFGTVYSLAIAIFGGTTQLVITWLLHVTGNAMSPAWYLIGAVAIGQIAIMLMAESAPVMQGRRAAGNLAAESA